MCVCVCPMHAQTSLPNWLKICVKALGVKADVFKNNWEPAARRPRPPNFVFEKVGTGMYYVHAKNIRCNPNPAAAASKTAPKPPRATEDGPVGRFSKFLFEKLGPCQKYRM